MTSSVSPETQKDLAPTGKLRVGLNYGNFLLVLKDRADGTPQGIAPDLARELAKRLEMGLEFVKFDAAGKLADGVKSGMWDVAFLGNEPQRAAEIAFSPAYLEIPVTYLVPAGSPIQSLADVDKPGVRISVTGRSAYGLWLDRHIEHATLVKTGTLDSACERFVNDKLEVLAGLRPRLLSDVEKLPGARILDGKFTAVQQAIGTARKNVAAAQFLRDFVEEAKTSGFVQSLIDKHKVRGLTVAAPV
jgi:polar amino acid transport system substrate-binding protein